MVGMEGFSEPEGKEAVLIVGILGVELNLATGEIHNICKKVLRG